MGKFTYEKGTHQVIPNYFHQDIHKYLLGKRSKTGYNPPIITLRFWGLTHKYGI